MTSMASKRLSNFRAEASPARSITPLDAEPIPPAREAPLEQHEARSQLARRALEDRGKLDLHVAQPPVHLATGDPGRLCLGTHDLYDTE